MAKVRIKRLYRTHRFGDLGAVEVVFHAYDARGKHIISKEVVGKIGTPDGAGIQHNYIAEIGGAAAVDIRADVPADATFVWELVK